MSGPPDEVSTVPGGSAGTLFEVDAAGTLRMGNYTEAETRAEFYEDFAGQWAGSSQNLRDTMEERTPPRLSGRVHLFVFPRSTCGSCLTLLSTGLIRTPQ